MDKKPPNTDQSKELLEVVDSKNQVIYLEERGVVHERQLMHRSVHVLVTNSVEKIFLQKRAMHKDCEPGMWDTSAAGHVDVGEQNLDAAKRELWEELGLKGSSLEEFGKFSPSRETGNEFVEIFICETANPITPDQVEIDDFGWFSLVEINGWMAADPNGFTSVFKHIFQQYCNKNQ
jgi:isopentenyldiphosphate isomerase